MNRRRALIAGITTLVCAGVAIVVLLLLSDGKDPESSRATASATATERTVPAPERARQVIREVRTRQGKPAINDEQQPDVPADNSPKARLLPGLLRPCAAARSFAVYGLGERFGGRYLASRSASCQRPPKVVHGVLAIPTRENNTVLNYGRCLTGGGEGGCDPEIQIQNVPACERPHALYHELAGDGDDSGEPHEHLTIQAVPAASFEDGRRIELYTATTTIVIFGPDRSTTAAAAAAIRSMTPDSSAPSTETGRLPKPDPAAAANKLSVVRC